MEISTIISICVFLFGVIFTLVGIVYNRTVVDAIKDIKNEFKDLAEKQSKSQHELASKIENLTKELYTHFILKDEHKDAVKEIKERLERLERELKP